MTTTYDSIATTTLTGTTTTITFDSIPSTYTDLVIIASPSGTSVSDRIWVRFNNDTSANYARTYIYGAVANISSNSAGGQSEMTPQPAGQTSGTLARFDILSYKDTNIYKSMLSHWGGGQSGYTQLAINRWANTSAITRIDLYTQSGGFLAGSVFSLYGIV